MNNRYQERSVQDVWIPGKLSVTHAATAYIFTVVPVSEADREALLGSGTTA